MSFTAADVRRVLLEGCSGVTELRHFQAGESLGSPAILWHDVEDRDGWAHDCLSLRDRRRQLYWGVATRKDASGGSRENCLELPAVFADLDFKDSSERDVRERLHAFPLPPGILLHSGGGLHAYWPLREPLLLQEAAEREQAERLLSGIITALRSDPACKDVARILRVPHSFNLKTATPRQVRIEVLDGDHRYNPSELHAVLEELGAFRPPVARSAPALPVGGSIPNGSRNRSLYIVGRGLHAKGLAEPAIHAALDAINVTACAPPLPDEEMAALKRQCVAQSDRSDFTPEGQADAPGDPAGAYDRALEAAVVRERAQREARRQLDSEARGPVLPPVFLTLQERLARPHPPMEWRINAWQPRGARALLAAQFKVGKTTLTGNLTRSLVDGDDFLDAYTIQPVAGTVAILDFEMSERQLDAWLQDQSIRNADRVLPLSLRGRAASFNILEQGVRKTWADALRDRGVQYLVLDCVRPALDALGLDENKDAGRFLVAFDALLEEAGISEALVVHHMGHSGERSRGDSRFRDWPDVEWRLFRQDEKNLASGRFVTAYGRDVNVDEQALDYNAQSRRLSLLGGSRRDHQASVAMRAVLELLAAGPKSGRAIETTLQAEYGRNVVRAALELASSEGHVSTEPGQNNAILHRLKTASVRQFATVRQSEAANSVRQCASAYRAHARTHRNGRLAWG